MLRAGDPRGLDAYEAHGRIIAGTLDEHLARDRHARGSTATTPGRRRRWWPPATITSTPSTPPCKTARIAAGHLDPDRSVVIAGGERAHLGDVVATRRNDRRLITTAGEPVRNRETWTVTAVHPTATSP